MNKMIPLTATSNFEDFISSGYYYVDKTGFIPQLEQKASKYLFYLRPRRFGKSLFLSMLEYYYGIQHRDKFGKLFSGLQAGEMNTPDRNSFYTILLNFSGISTQDTQFIREKFDLETGTKLVRFLDSINAGTDSEKQSLLEVSGSSEKLRLFAAIFRKYLPEGKIFLLIDEYDHFTNELISFDHEHFREIVSRNGWVRKFYEVVKQLMAEGIIDRFFATGVTPVTLDSMTSGFNVAQNITLDHKFHSLTGFTESEVVKLISETMPAGEQFDSLELLNNLRSWYNGSRFSPSAEEKLYNPQMILSFLREFRDTYTYSGMMSDINVTSDWKKIDNIISQLPPGTAESVIDQVLNNDYITDSLTLLYNPETPFTKTDVISLLFYNGLLSIDGITAGFYKYVIPNYLIRQLYWEFFRNRMEREKNLDLSSNTLAPVFIEMAYEGKIGKLIGKISDVMKILSNNDFQNFRESELKMIALAILSVNKIYMIKSEAPAGSGRVDLLLLKNKDFDTKYQYLIELKFVKVKDSSKIPAVAAEAETQALRYLNSEDISNLENLKAYTVVFHNRFEAEVKLIN